MPKPDKTPTAKERSFAIGRSNAAEALDQGGRADLRVLEDYWQNMADTIAADDQLLWDDAMRGFMTVIKTQKITFSPPWT